MLQPNQKGYGMIKNKKLLYALSALFFTVEAILGAVLQTTYGTPSDACRYAAVVLACLFSLALAEKSRAFLYTQTALVFTVAADYFLVLRPEAKQLPAMIFFSLAHIAYLLRLYNEDTGKTRNTVRLVTHAGLSLLVLIVTAAVLGENCDALALVSMFAFTNLALNTVFAQITLRKNPLIAVGLLLFLLCDTVIGLIFLKNYLPIPADSALYSILYPGFDLAWAFYLPAQALLAASLLPRRLKGRTK